MKKRIIQTVDKEPLEVAIVNIDLTIGKDKLVVTQSNPLATSVQQMTLQEKRLLLLAMSYIRQSHNDFMLYRIPITKIQECLEIDNTISYERIKEVSKKLLTRLVEIDDGKGNWEVFQWLSYCRYYSKENSETSEACLEIRFHDHLRPFLLNLKKHFGSLRLLQLAAMPSFNSIRVCEILFHSCNSFTKMEFYFSVDELKKRLNMTDKYLNFKDFRLRILKQAQRDCAEYSPLTFTWTEEKKGRKIIALRFKIQKNSKFKDELPPLPKFNQPKPKPTRTNLEEQAEKDKKYKLQAIHEQRKKEGKRLEDLEASFNKERRNKINKLIKSWNQETLDAELEEFDKNLTSILVRERLKKQGLTSRIAKAAFVEYLSKKYLSPEENDFVKWTSFK